MLIHGD